MNQLTAAEFNCRKKTAACLLVVKIISCQNYACSTDTKNARKTVVVANQKHSWFIKIWTGVISVDFHTFTKVLLPGISGIE